MVRTDGVPTIACGATRPKRATKNVYEVRDRNRPGVVLAGPFATYFEAYDECQQWRGATDAYVLDTR